jgi:hypothetical protein
MKYIFTLSPKSSLISLTSTIEATSKCLIPDENKCDKTWRSGLLFTEYKISVEFLVDEKLSAKK